MQDKNIIIRNVVGYDGPSVVHDTKTEWRVLIDNLPPRDIKYWHFAGYVSLTTLRPLWLCNVNSNKTTKAVHFL